MSSPSEEIKPEELTFIERLDLDKQRKSHELAMKREDTIRFEAEQRRIVRRARAEVWGWTGLGFMVVVLALGLAWIIWQGTKGPSDKDQRNQEQYRMCVVEKSGTWIPADTDHGPICVANGKAETK